MPSKWVVMVVHGVGETKAGATIDDFVPTLANARPCVRPDGNVEVHQLRDAPKSKQPKPTDPLPLFPVHVRRAECAWAGNGPSEVVLGEVYWSDLAGIRDGMISTVFSLIQTIFSLRFIADQAAVMPAQDQAKWGVRGAARWLRAILYSTAFLLCGPIAALSSLLACVLVVDQWMMPAIETYWGIASQRELILGATGVLAVLLGEFFHQRAVRGNWSGVTYRFWRSFEVAGFLFVLVVLAHAKWFSPADWEASRSWLAWWIGYEPAPQNPGRLAYATILLAAIQAVFLVVSLLATLGFFLWLFAWLRAPKPWKPALSVAYGAGLMQIVLWLLLTPLLAMLAIKTFLSDNDQRHRLNALLERIQGAFSVYLGFTLILVGLVYITWLRRDQWAGKQQGPLEYPHRNGKDIARLIVHWTVLACLIVLSFLTCVASPVIAFSGRRPDLFPTIVSDLSIAVAVPLFMLALTYFRSGLREGLHVVTDIINHFYRRHDLFPRPWGTEAPVNVRDFEIQQRIEHRFHHVLEHLLQDSGATHLSIVAHSQGTIISVDVLSLSGMDHPTRDRINNRLKSLKEIHLVTMGSPLGHLYQHYFPSRYQPLDSNVWNGLTDRPNLRWVNVYRLDDYIGTFIREAAHPHRQAPGFPAKETQLPINLPIEPGGHTAYWRQPPVFQHNDLGRSLPG